MFSARWVFVCAAWLLVVPYPAVAQVVINEIDYDQPGSDDAEYFELENVGSLSVDLSEYTVELVNGNGGGASVYATINSMSGTLAAGDYFVVCANAAATPNCDLQALSASNAIQNGAPDAIGLRHLGVLVDAVSYEGDTGAPYTEGTGALGDAGVSAGMGLSRIPNGSDTDDNSMDFVVHANTPGTSNDGTPNIPVAGTIALLTLGAALAGTGARYLSRC